ncbi:circularly permuted type 2 ATP-grasp protein [Nocardia mexicana]|uniref:Putative circularly permuted ATP-grasp superfamily protein n=1 Tax=Nocardia mexicana TaxID=279262 RepID=A0A370GJD3_9NOCA|nr:circularly permuted type 2 ATP-grasp protein [Nocardia mexicana]RDI43908.1 putative circularly permuted ATP-grasp superfamily protein [Nocardia mexicana]
MAMRDVEPGVRDVDVPEQVAAEFARYRSTGARTAPFDACGLPAPGYYDELVDAEGRVRPMWSELSADFVEQGPGGLDALDGRVRRLIEDDGITYTEVPQIRQTDEPARSAPWRLDPIPLLVSADDWSGLEAGLVQRSRLLDAVLADVYGPRRLLTGGVLPPEIVYGCGGYIRAAHGISVPGRHQLFLHACDISRWGGGEFRVLTDWAQAPSGAGYALADRRVVSAAIPEAFEHSSPRPLGPFARAMRLMLIEAAPRAADDPVVVVLSPGAHSETAYDQAHLASVLGFPLVESADLVVRDGMLWMRSLGTLRRVDVVLRRVDAEFSDPLDLRPDSRLGVVGLVEVLRRGAVTVVNTLGSGLLESPALAAMLPALSRELFGEELKLPGAPSYWGGVEAERRHLVANLDRMVIRSAIDGSTLFGPALSAAERAELRARIDSRGWQWVGQEPPQFSVAPAVTGAGGLTAAPVGVRLFSLAGRVGYRVMPGGLGQLHQRLQPDRSVIKVAAKDVWVRAAPAAVAAVGPEPAYEERVRPTSVAPVLEAISSPRVLNDLFWLGRYGERAEATVRLLLATHNQYQDYRYRPWLEGADAVPVLMTALARMTGTRPPFVKPDALEMISPTRPDPGTKAQQQSQVAEITVAQQQQAQAGGGRRAVAGASREGHDYLMRLTVDRELPGSLAYAVDHYGAGARSVRDQLSSDTWMILSATERALAKCRSDTRDQESALSTVFPAVLASLLSLHGIDSESMVRDTGWYVTDIGKRIERGLALAALLSAALTQTYPEEVGRIVTETVLRATESSVSYRRRHRDSIRISAVAGLLLFDAANPRSLAYQLERLETDLNALPGTSGTSRPQRLLADTQRTLRRLDPADLESTDAHGRRVEFADLLAALHLRLRKLSESFETSRLSGPGGIQPLWGRVKVIE